MDTLLIAILASVIGGYLIRRSAETQTWRQTLQILLALGATIYAFTNSGLVWAVVVLVGVFILQSLFMAIFRFIGLRRFAKNMGVDIINRDDKE